MKKFSFELAPVLRWREAESEREKKALEQLHAQEQDLQRNRTELQRSLENAAGLLAMSGAVDAAELAYLAQFESAVKVKEQRLAHDQEVCRKQIVEQRVRCTDAGRAQELLERLKEQKFSDWKRDFDRESETSATDSYLATWSRTRRDS